MKHQIEEKTDVSRTTVQNWLDDEAEIEVDPERVMKVIMNLDFITRDNAWQLASAMWSEMPDMSPENWRVLCYSSREG